MDNPLGIAYSHPKYCLSIASEPHTGAPWVFVYCGYSNPNAHLAHCSRRFCTAPGDTAFHVDDCGYYTRDGTFLIDDRGAALLKGTLSESVPTLAATSGSDLLVYGNGGSDLVAVVEKSSGDMDIAGGLDEFQDPVPAPTVTALEIMGYDYNGDSNPDLVGYIDKSGNMKLRGLFFDDNDLLNGLSWAID